MAIALVKAGTMVSTAAAGTITPTFGQATTAGNLVVAWITPSNGTSVTSPSGWTTVESGTQGAIAYKPNCVSSESNPVFTFGSTPATAFAVLAEFSGVATSNPLDQHTSTAIGAPTSVTAPAPDATASNLAVVAFGLTGSKTATVTYADSWTPTGGSSGSIANSGATSGTFWGDAVYYLLNTHGGSAADSDSITPTFSKGVISSSGIAIATFKPPTAFIASSNHAISQAVKRSGTY